MAIPTPFLAAFSLFSNHSFSSVVRRYRKIESGRIFQSLWCWNKTDIVIGGIGIHLLSLGKMCKERFGIVVARVDWGIVRVVVAGCVRVNGWTLSCFSLCSTCKFPLFIMSMYESLYFYLLISAVAPLRLRDSSFRTKSLTCHRESGRDSLGIWHRLYHVLHRWSHVHSLS